MKQAEAFVIVALVVLSTAVTAQDGNKPGIAQAGSSSEKADVDVVRVPKELLREFSIPPLDVTDHETMQFVLTEKFITTYKLTESEVEKMSQAIADALHAFRTAEARNLEPTGEPPKNGLPAAAQGDQVFYFRLTPFREEAGAIRKKLEEEVRSALGEERTRYFWATDYLGGEMPTFTKPPYTIPDAKITTTYTFVLPARNPGVVRRYIIQDFEVAGGNGASTSGRAYGAPLDRYAPDALRPVLAGWRKTVGEAKSETQNGEIPKRDPLPRPFATVQSSDKWDEKSPFAQVPKGAVNSLRIPGLTVEEELSQEAITLFDLSEEEQKAITELYREMRTRFEKLERVHFERAQPDKNSFVIKAFPDESATLKREWVEKLKGILGAERGDQLNRSIQTPPRLRDFRPEGGNGRPMREDRRRMLEAGQTWLHRGTSETKLNVSPMLDRNGQRTYRIEHQTGGEGGGRGSGGFGEGQIPKRWQHLLTPDILGVPTIL